MAAKKKRLSIVDKDASSSLKLIDINYLGSGTYECRLQVSSSGFSCDRLFGFDNDEYFLAKAREVIDTQSGEADLMDLQADSYVRLKPFDNDSVLVAGFIVEDTQVTQSIEFAFTVDRERAVKFVAEFEKMIRANI